MFIFSKYWLHNFIDGWEDKVPALPQFKANLFSLLQIFLFHVKCSHF